MEKVTVEIFRVHKNFKVKFSMIMKDDDPNKFQKMISKFNFNGNNYLKITPFPYLTFDITSKMDKNEEWNSNRSANLNRRELFVLINKLRRLISNFKIKDLFFYDKNNKLQVNENIAASIKETTLFGNKVVVFQPCVVESEENHQIYEGCFMFINSMDYFTYITYTELEYLVYELSRIDFSSLTLQVINSYYLLENLEAQKLNKKAPLVESKESEIIDVKARIGIEEPSTIPEI